MKILTNRISNILISNTNVLEENNFAVLSGRSTHEPIHILNNIMEDGGCTVCQAHWHSFRRDKDAAGRILSLMMIK